MKTPREKAAELIVNYQLKCKSLDYEQAKQCALIAVDELIEEARDYGDDNHRQDRLIYLDEVKDQLEKLS
jgi:hypothetical protein